MARFNKKPSTKGRPSRRPPMAVSGPVDFSPLLPFLQKRLGDDHPICNAARTSDLATFMAAIRESEDSKIEHEIAGELVRIAEPLPRS